MTGLLCFAFFISGATALIFESLWFRQAGLAFGNSLWASSLVLSGFMAGLALGNALAAKAFLKLKNPVRIYAVLELIIGLAGVLLVRFLPQIGHSLAPLFHSIQGQSWLLNASRLLLAFILLLVPSTAMGMTLPLLTQALSSTDPLFGRVLGRLYGWNTLGAVFGVLLSEFVLIEAVGVQATAGFAGFLNLSVAALAFRLSTRLQARRSAKEALAKPAPEESPCRAWRYLAAAFVAGFCLLALEVVWFRFLLLFVTGHSTSFSLMLGIILAGISLGGFAASQAGKRWPGIAQALSSTAFLLGLATVLSYGLFSLVIAPFHNAVLSQASDILKVGLPLMMPVSCLSGFFFTLAGMALRKHLPSASGTTGRLTLANTCGAAFGAFSAGFFLLPRLGMERSFFLIAALYGLTGLFLLRTQARNFRLGYAAALSFALAILFFPNGAMTDYLLVPSQRLLAPGESGRVIEIREGQMETIAYLEQQWQGKPLFYRLLTNSYSMSSSDVRSRRYMKLFVYWPLALHPGPKDALLISYGIGSTAKALTDSKELKHIDVVDISRDILEMNDIVFPDPSEHPLKDPRVKVHVEDGRYFLQTTKQHFDLITAEPPPPELSGVVNLYTREYFQLLHDRLNKGGMVSYWLPLHAIDAESVKAILRAFCDVFEDCSLWHGQWLDLIMIGSRGAEGPVSEARFRRQWEDPRVSRELSALGLERPEQLGALFIGDARYLNGLTRGVWPLVDDFPKRLKTAKGRRMALVQLIDRWTDTTETQQRFVKSRLIRRLWPEKMRQASLPYFSYLEMLHRLWFGFRTQAVPLIADLHRALSESELKTLPLWLLGSHADFKRVLSTLEGESLKDPLVQARIGMQHLSERRYAAAAAAFAKAEADPKLAGDAFSFRIYALSMAGREEEARQLTAERMSNFLEVQKKGPVPGLSPFWSWMKRKRGIDPFSQRKKHTAEGKLS